MSGRLSLLLACAAVALLSCTGGGQVQGSDPPAATGDRGGELTIYAAASLGPVLQSLRTSYVASHPGTTIAIATDSSAALEEQIEQGAGADLFLSADLVNPQKLSDRGFAAGPVGRFADNRLALVVPSSNPAGIRSPRDLARPGLRIVATARSVPIAVYTGQLLERLAKEPGYPADFVGRYDANVASREINVAAVLAKIELGEGDAGIVYATDAIRSRNVVQVAIPPDANVAASYGAIVLKASSHISEANAFLDWLTGPEGQRILATFGFERGS